MEEYICFNYTSKWQRMTYVKICLYGICEKNHFEADIQDSLQVRQSFAKKNSLHDLVMGLTHTNLDVSGMYKPKIIVRLCIGEETMDITAF